jgi:hypothetical protein
MSKVGVTSEQLGRAFAVGIGAAWLYFRVATGDDLKTFWPTSTIVVPLMIFVIFWLAEGVAQFDSLIDHLKRLRNKLIDLLTRRLDSIRERLPEPGQRQTTMVTPQLLAE